MRSTNIVIFLVLLNATAGFAGVLFATPLDPALGQDAKIEDASSSLSTAEVSEPAAGEVTGSILQNAGLIETIDGIVFAGPNMLGALGMPAIFVGGFKAVLGFVVAFDVAEGVTGREFS
jgi:hypothetical protein